MPKIIFNAFASLQKKLKKQKIDYANAEIEIVSGLSAKSLVFQIGFGMDEIEAVLINGRVASFDTILKDGDRVAFVPRFTTGGTSHLSGLKYLR